MFVVVFNQNNIVQDGQNNKLIFKFPNSVQFKNHYIAVSSVSMYYSWFNITSSLGNNIFSYNWVDSAGATITYTAIIPDGVYEIVDLNNFIQFTCIQNGTYWVDGGINYYPFEIILNPTRYAVQLNTYFIYNPANAPLTITQTPNPVGGAPGWPAFRQNVAVTIPAKLTTLLGFSVPITTAINSGGAYVPPAGQSLIAKNSINTISYLSNIAPQVQPNGSLYLSISNISNPYTQPSSIIYAINPSVAVGEQIIERPPNYSWSKLIDGTYNQLSLTFLGSDLVPIQIKDPNMTIILVLREGSESFLGTK
jgi:hypothetical protein